MQQRFRIHLLPQSFDTERVVSDELGREEFFHSDLCDASARTADIAKPDTLHALGRSDFDQTVVARGHRAGRE